MGVEQFLSARLVAEMVLAEVFAIVAWYVVLLGLTLVAAPVALAVFSPLPTKGIGFSKALGVLLVGLTFWMLVSLGITNNDLGGVVVAIVLVGGLGIYLAAGERSGKRIGGQSSAPVVSGFGHHLKGVFVDVFRRSWRYEIVFGAAFLIAVIVRAQHPAIAATEKPMEFAFLNSVSIAEAYPPQDPWLSGYSISYYYLGYVLSSVVGRLAGTAPAVTFNLATAMFSALVAVGAYELIVNLVGVAPGRKKMGWAEQSISLLGAFAIPFMGNLQVLLELAHARLYSLLGSSFWRWLDIKELVAEPISSGRIFNRSWWWWRSSRVIHEYELGGVVENGLEPIAEFPAFSLLLGDLHPHVMALPFAVVAIGFGLLLFMLSGKKSPGARIASRWYIGVAALDETMELLDRIGVGRVLFGAVLFGALAFLNTWDAVIYLGLFALSTFTGSLSRKADWAGAARATLGYLIVTAVAGAIVVAPFLLGFRSQAGAPFILPNLVEPTRASQMLVIFGVPMVALGMGAAVAFGRRAVGSGNVAKGAIVALAALGFVFVLALLISLGSDSQDSWVRAFGSARGIGIAEGAPKFVSLVRVLPKLVAEKARSSSSIAILALGVGVAAATVISRARITVREVEQHWRPGYTALVAGLGFLLILAPEFVFLKDNFNARMNTVFKFYYQAWLLIGIGSVVAVIGIRRVARVGSVMAALWALLVVASMSFLPLAAQSRHVEYYGASTAESASASMTLDGLAYLDKYEMGERDAVEWLSRQADSSDVVVESTGGQYSGYGRISSRSGLSTLLGWAGHEQQWRGSSTPSLAPRVEAIDQIYRATSWELTSALIEDYGVDWIVFGELEATKYGQGAAAKLERYLPLAFESGSVRIFSSS